MASRSLTAVALLSLPLFASAFLPAGIPSALAPKAKLLSSSVRCPRFAGVTGLKAASTFGLSARAGDKDEIVQSRVPSDPKSKCACGMSFHQTGVAPEDPVDLIRARYSAYAYRLPGYIMRSTSRKSPDWTVNQTAEGQRSKEALTSMISGEQAAWIEDIVDFCDSYRFKRPGGQVLGMELEECTYSSPDVCYVQFKAKLLGPGYRPVELVERSRVLRENGRWLYEKGTLLEYQGDLV